MEAKFMMAYVFYGSAGAGTCPWCEQILAEPVPLPEWPNTKDVVTALVLAGADLSALYKHGKREDLVGDTKNWRDRANSKIYPVLVAGDQVFALTPFATDDRGDFPPRPEGYWEPEED